MIDIERHDELPLVSVILCVFNGGNKVQYAISDILEQSYGNIELIISDDASTDNTWDIICQFKTISRVRIFRQSQNLGFVKNKNFAISQARGQFITQQDHDDRSHPSRIERQMRQISKTGMLIVGCGVRRIDSKGITLKIIAAPRDTVIDTIPSGGLPFFFAPTLFSREVWKQHGPFNDYFSTSFGEDFYFISCALRTHPIAVISDCLYDYVDRPRSLTSSLRSTRAFAMPVILQELAHQNENTGTNRLEDGDWKWMQNRENELLNNKRFVAENFRIYAARAIDGGEFREAVFLLTQSAKLNVVSIKLLKTTIYLLRRIAVRSK